MTYTHYFAYRPQDPRWAEIWPQLVQDAQRIIDAVQPDGAYFAGSGEDGIALAGGDGTGAPVIGPDCILLNGQGDEACESLYIGGPSEADDDLASTPPGDNYVFGHPRTRELPYDGVVCAILMRAAQLYPEGFVFGSEGKWEQEWLYGTGESVSPRDLVRSLFGTDDMPARTAEYFFDDVEPVELFADLQRAAVMRNAPAVAALPLEDALFRDGPGLGF